MDVSQCDVALLTRLHLNSASHVVLLLVKKYPQCKIVNMDRLDCKFDFIVVSQIFICICCFSFASRQIAHVLKIWMRSKITQTIALFVATFVVRIW